MPLFYDLDEYLPEPSPVIDRITQSQRELLASVFVEAADDIVEFGWRKGSGYDTDPNGDYTRCVWIASQRSFTRFNTANNNILNHDSDLLRAFDEALFIAAEVSNNDELFDKNDSQPNEEGQAWAYGVLISASRILNPALVHGEPKTDSSLTAKTDTGSTPNASSRLFSFLKRFTWVR